MKASDVKKELFEMSSPEGREKTEYYFKTGAGTYSAHDEFIGVRMPDIRRIAKEYKDLAQSEIWKLLGSKVHEDRLCALIILVLQMKLAVKINDQHKIREIAEFYIANRVHINNWDLVDASAHYIVGQYVLSYPEKSDILYELAKSDVMWDRRIAMVTQWLMIRDGVYDHVLPLAQSLLSDEEDLMHKAVGWMLREYWKKDSVTVEKFLAKNYEKLPRTTLRYAIERVEASRRKLMLKGQFT